MKNESFRNDSYFFIIFRRNHLLYINIPILNKCFLNRINNLIADSKKIDSNYNHFWAFLKSFKLISTASSKSSY